MFSHYRRHHGCCRHSRDHNTQDFPEPKWTDGTNIRRQPWGTPQPFNAGLKAKISLEMVYTLFPLNQRVRSKHNMTEQKIGATTGSKRLCACGRTHRSEAIHVSGQDSEDVFIEHTRRSQSVIYLCISVKKQTTLFSLTLGQMFQHRWPTRYLSPRRVSDIFQSDKVSPV